MSSGVPRKSWGLGQAMKFTNSMAGWTQGRGKKRLAWTFGILVVLLAIWSVTGGLIWSLCFHPDELTIARWIDVVKREGYLTARAYPTGWFELFRAQFWLEEKLPKWQESWDKHRIQDGRVNAVAEKSFVLRTPEPLPEKAYHTIQDGRDFNAWLYVLAVLLLYAACLEAGLHPAAAFVSGLFFVGTAAPLEFAHYCETDTALLVSMAFFAWLSARALRKQSILLALLGALAAGFAVACKFTLAPLLLWCAAGPTAVLWERRKTWGRGRWWGTLAGLVLLGIGLAYYGYLLGTPALRIAPAWYMQEMKSVSQATYNEILRPLGGHYTWSGATMLRIRSLLDHLGDMGWLPLVWGTIAWGFWFARKNRKQLAGLPWLFPLFFPFWVCWCPFVRRQEMLPLAVLLAFGAALPFQWVFGDGTQIRKMQGWKWWTLAALMVLLGAGALFVQGGMAMAMKACFQMRDTRAEAQNWLRDAMPQETPVALDAYVAQVNRGVWFDARWDSGLAYKWKGIPPEEQGIAARYYVENMGFAGRLPIRNPKTGILYPEVKASLAAFEEAVFPIRTWKVSRTTPVPVFAQQSTRLLSFDKPVEGALDVAIGHARPILMQPDGSRLYGAGGPAGIGAHHAIHTVGKRTWVHLNLEEGERWLVTRWLEGPGDKVQILREGLFQPQKADLVANGAVAAKLKPGVFDKLRARMSAHAGSRCRMRGDDQTVCCGSYLAQSAAEAAGELRRAGNAHAALELLKKKKKLDTPGCVEAFLAATTLGELPEAEWTAAARTSVETMERLLAEREQLGRTGASICGVPLGVVEDFARLKMPHQLMEPGKKLSAWLPPGRYEVSVTANVENPSVVPTRLFEGQTDVYAAEDLNDGWWRLTMALDLENGQFLHIAGEEGDDYFEPFRANVEICWSPLDRMAETARTIRDALARSEDEAVDMGDGT